MPQLQRNAAALGMHGLGHALPACHLLCRPDARRIGIAHAHGHDRSGLCQDQTGAGTLAVMRDLQITGRAAVESTHAGQRSHDHAVRQGKCADVKRFGELRHDERQTVSKGK